MKCAVHSEADATGFCRSCGKAMCPACARPVREVLYCENCLASGMGMPASPPPANPYADPVAAQSAFVPPPVAAVPPPQRGAASGAIAFVLGLFPGLGAVYNGEYNKALVHVVVVFALIFAMATAEDMGAGGYVMLALLLAGFELYMAFDAMRVAQAKSTGQTVSDPLNEVTRNLPIGPVILIGIGALWLLDNFRVFPFFNLSLGRLWPLILIAAGVLMFRNRAGRS